MPTKTRKGANRGGVRRGIAAITVRLPQEDYESLRKQAEARGVSLNCLAAEALAQYRVGQQRLQLLKEIDAFRKRLEERHGVGEDSVHALRAMRLARVKHLCGEEEGPEEP
ncbi:MAG: hypothetical protein QME79_07045 [Bacillota bacterium]|nr:hypothetical protein [Bacillota bacterium]